MSLTIICKAGDQLSTNPMGVRDQSNSPIRHGQALWRGIGTVISGVMLIATLRVASMRKKNLL